MSGSITGHFTEEFNAELYTALQNKGGMMRGRVRRKTGVTGITTKFPKIGTAGPALPKMRNGKVPMLDIARTRVDCTLYDRYGADMIDDLDELKTNVAERAAVASAIAMSLARSEDDFALNALALSGNAANSLAANDAFASDVVPRGILEVFGTNEAMEGGQMNALVTWRAWTDLLTLNSFINSDYGGDTLMTVEGQRPKNYFGFAYAPFSRLPIHVASGARLNIWWNSNCIGVAVGKEITPETAWLSDYDAWFIKGKMRMGSVIIDETGVVLRRYAA
jgi:hypothetical protein